VFPGIGRKGGAVSEADSGVFPGIRRKGGAVSETDSGIFPGIRRKGGAVSEAESVVLPEIRREGGAVSEAEIVVLAGIGREGGAVSDVDRALWHQQPVSVHHVRSLMAQVPAEGQREKRGYSKESEFVFEELSHENLLENRS